MKDFTWFYEKTWSTCSFEYCSISDSLWSSHHVIRSFFTVIITFWSLSIDPPTGVDKLLARCRLTTFWDVKSLRLTRFSGFANFALLNRKKLLDLQIFSRIDKKWESYSEHHRAYKVLVMLMHMMTSKLIYLLVYSKTFT